MALVDQAQDYAEHELKKEKSAQYWMQLGRDALADGHAYSVSNRVQGYQNARKDYAAARGLAQKIAKLTEDASKANDQQALAALGAKAFFRPDECYARAADYQAQMQQAVEEAAALGAVIGTPSGGPLPGGEADPDGSAGGWTTLAAIAAAGAAAWWWFVGRRK